MNSSLALAALASAALATLSLATPAAAADRGPYFGFGIGQSRIGFDTARIDANALGAGFGSSTTVADNTDGAWKLYGGYRYNRHLAVEVGYTDFGRISTRTVTTAPAGVLGSDTQGNAWSLDAVGLIPLSPSAALFGKLGVHRWATEGRVPAVAGGTATTVGARDTGTGWKYGLGAQFEVSRTAFLRVEWERLRDVGNAATTGRGDVDVWTFGLHYRF